MLLSLGSQKRRDLTDSRMGQKTASGLCTDTACEKKKRYESGERKRHQLGCLDEPCRSANRQSSAPHRQGPRDSSSPESMILCVESSTNCEYAPLRHGLSATRGVTSDPFDFGLITVVLWTCFSIQKLLAFFPFCICGAPGIASDSHYRSSLSFQDHLFCAHSKRTIHCLFRKIALLVALISNDLALLESHTAAAAVH